MASITGPFRKPTQRMENTQTSLTGGLCTDYSMTEAPEDSFTILENMDLNKWGALQTRPGFKMQYEIVFKPNAIWGSDFNSKNFQGVLLYKDESKTERQFYLIDGLLFDSSGNDLTPSITLDIILEYDENRQNPDPQMQFNILNINITKCLKKDRATPIRLNRTAQHVIGSMYLAQYYIPISLEQDFNNFIDNSVVIETDYFHNSFLLHYDGLTWKFMSPYVPNFKECEIVGFNNLVYSAFDQSNVFAPKQLGNDIVRKLSYYLKNTQGKKQVPNTSHLPETVKDPKTETANEVFATPIDICTYPLEPIVLDTGANSATVVVDYINQTTVISGLLSLGDAEVQEINFQGKILYSLKNNYSPQQIAIHYEVEGDQPVFIREDVTFYNFVDLSTHGSPFSGFVWGPPNEFFTQKDYDTLMLKIPGAPDTLNSNPQIYQLEKPMEYNFKTLPGQAYPLILQALVDSLNNKKPISKFTVQLSVFSPSRATEWDFTDWMQSIYDKFKHCSTITFDKTDNIKATLQYGLNLFIGPDAYTAYYNCPIKLIIEGFKINGTLITAENNSLIYIKAHLATDAHSTTSVGYDYKHLDTDFDPTQPPIIKWFKYDITNGDNLWNYEIWESQPVFEPTSPDAASLVIRPYKPNFDKWEQITDPITVTPAASIIQLWSPPNLFLLGCQVWKSDNTVKPDPKVDGQWTNYYKVMSISHSAKDYFVDFAQIGACDKTWVRDGQLFIWNSTPQKGKNNRIFVSQVNNFGYFPSDNYIDLDINNDEQILGFTNFHDYIMVSTTNKLFLLQGDNPSNFKIIPMNQNMRGISRESFENFENFIYYANEDAIWMVKPQYNVKDRAYLEQLTKPIRTGTYLPLKDKTNSFAVCRGDVIFWIFPTDGVALKYYPNLSEFKKRPVWSVDRSSVFNNLVFARLDPVDNQLGFWTYDPTKNKIAYLVQTTYLDNFFVDYSTDNPIKYSLRFESVYRNIGFPLNTKMFFYLEWQLILPTDASQQAALNLSNLKMKINVYGDGQQIYGGPSYTKDAFGNIYDETEKFEEIQQGLWTNRVSSILDSTTSGKTIIVTKGIDIGGSMAKSIAYEIIIDEPTLFNLDAYLVNFKILKSLYGVNFGGGQS